MKGLLPILAISLVLFLYVGSPMHADNSVTIIGFIEADLENEDHEVVTIGIWDDEASEYTYIAPGKGRGDELKSYLGWKVKVVGTIAIGMHGTEYLKVHEYKLISSPAENEEDENLQSV